MSPDALFVPELEDAADRTIGLWELPKGWGMGTAVARQPKLSLGNRLHQIPITTSSEAYPSFKENLSLARLSPYYALESGANSPGKLFQS